VAIHAKGIENLSLQFHSGQALSIVEWMVNFKESVTIVNRK
jgi:hypothetical protein